MKFIRFIKDSIAWLDYDQKSRIEKLKFWLHFPFVYAISTYFKGSEHWK